MRVRDLMTPNPITLTAGDSLGDALATMQKHRIRELPVLDEGRVVGMCNAGCRDKVVADAEAWPQVMALLG